MTTKGRANGPYTVRGLDGSTWDDFAELVERNGGVMGGCWCQNNHRQPSLRTPADKRAAKVERVRAGRAHAALVFDADGLAQGWAQYGSPEELPALTHRRAYAQDPPPPADWRIICIFVDKRHRKQGVARAALHGAVALIAKAGGGRIEAISQTTAGQALLDPHQGPPPNAGRVTPAGASATRYGSGRTDGRTGAGARLPCLSRHVGGVPTREGAR